MGLNITHTMNSSHYENRENLRNTAKNILNRNTSSPEAVQRIVEPLFNSGSEQFSSQMILSTSAQITLNNSLKETLKYLQNSRKKQEKKVVLGELWKTIEENSVEYDGELIDLVIDFDAQNIFAAA